MKSKLLSLSFPVTALAVAVVVSTSVSVSQDQADEAGAKIAASLPTEAPAKPKQKRKLLVFSKTNGFRHGSIPVGAQAMKLLGERTGAFEITHTEDDAAFEPESLAQYDAVLMLNTTGDIFRPKDMPTDEAGKAKALEREERLKKSLVEFVEGGKGLAGIHAATDTYHGWKAYNDMMGGTFDGHPWNANERVGIRNLAPGHPLNAAFAGQGFEITDEIYQFKDGTADPKERKMLLALDKANTDLKKGKYGEDGLYPISWLRACGKGRNFYCSLGHRDDIYWNPAVLKHYLAGLQYALGDLDADATAAAAPGVVVRESAVAAR